MDPGGLDPAMDRHFLKNMKQNIQKQRLSMVNLRYCPLKTSH